MPKIHIDRVMIRLRGVSLDQARRAAGGLRPALQRALAGGADTSAATSSRGQPLVERIAQPLATRIRGGSR